MTELNVLSRTQRIIVDPLTSAVAVVFAGQTGPAGPVSYTVGTPVISGLSYHGASPGTLVTVSGGSGVNIFLDPTAAGKLDQRGTDIALVPNGASTYQYRILTNGLYHINGYIRAEATAPPAGSVFGIRVNGTAIRRETMVAVAYSSCNVSCDAYLVYGDLVSLFAYTTGGNWYASYVAPTPIDGWSPRFDVWRISGVA